MTPQIIVAASVSKQADWDCQDAYSYSLTAGRFAVADGVSTASFMSKQFAQRLADTFVTMKVQEDLALEPQSIGAHKFYCHELNPSVLHNFVQKAQSDWQEDARRYLVGASEFQRGGWASGETKSAATLAAVSIGVVNEKPAINAMAVGDCYVFVGDTQDTVRLVTGAVRFGGYETESICISETRKTADKVIPRLVGAVIEVDRDPLFVLLTSDYLGEHLRKKFEADRGAWIQLLQDMMRLEHQSDIYSWLQRELELEAFRFRDDASICLVCYSASSASVKATAISQRPALAGASDAPPDLATTALKLTGGDGEPSAAPAQIPVSPDGPHSATPPIPAIPDPLSTPLPLRPAAIGQAQAQPEPLTHEAAESASFGAMYAPGMPRAPQNPEAQGFAPRPGRPHQAQPSNADETADRLTQPGNGKPSIDRSREIRSVVLVLMGMQLLTLAIAVGSYVSIHREVQFLGTEFRRVVSATQSESSESPSRRRITQPAGKNVDGSNILDSGQRDRPSGAGNEDEILNSLRNSVRSCVLSMHRDPAMASVSVTAAQKSLLSGKENIDDFKLVRFWADYYVSYKRTGVENAIDLDLPVELLAKLSGDPLYTVLEGLRTKSMKSQEAIERLAKLPCPVKAGRN